MEWYPWLNEPYRQLIAQYQQARGHHAILLHALPGMGAASFVYAFARRLLCRHPDGMKSCGVCHDCRLMMAGTHPDWHVPQPEKGRQTLGVDAVREVLDSLYQRSRQGGAKLVWIEKADLLTDAAANALLKTLEEPPEATYFVLGCYEPARLPATLRSRCISLYLRAPDETHGVQWLNGRHPQDALALRTALRLQSGAPLAAESLLQPAHWEQRAALCQALAAALPQRSFFSLLPQLNHDDAAARIHWLAALLLDAIKWQSGLSQALVNQDQLPLVELCAGTLRASALQSVLRQWLTCRQRLLSVSGVNRELLLSEVLLDWEQA